MWEAGYAIDVGIRTANSKLVNQFADGGSSAALPTRFDLRSSVWFLRNKLYGTVFVGTTFAATDRIANSNVTQTGMFDQYAAPENAGLGMFLRSAVNGRLTDSLLNWRRIIGAGGDQPGESQRGFSLLKYVSPTWNGFTSAADWVVTDFWDVALRYRKEIAGFDIAAGIGYLQLTPGSRTRSVCPAAFLAFIGRRDRLQSAARLGQRHASRYRTVRELRRRPDRATASRRNDALPRHRRRRPEIFYSGQAGIERPFLRSARRRSMATTTRMTAAPRRRCSSARATRSTRPASVIGRFGGPTSTFGVAASPRASIAPR